jgi:hypothetical protein
MARAGAFMVRMGVDSLEPSILRQMTRPQNVTGILREMRMLRERGIQVDANVITGFPGETRETVLSTISQLTPITTESDQCFAAGQRRFFDTLIETDYAQMPIEAVASVMVNVYPFQMRPGSRMYDTPEQDGISYRHFAPESFGHPLPESVAELVRAIPDSFEGEVPAHEILQRVRVIYRALHQPGDAMARVRATAINLWLQARCLEGDDVVGPLRRVAIYVDDHLQRVLHVAAANRHLPLRGELAVVVDQLAARGSVRVGELLALGRPAAIRNALALLIGAGLLPPARLPGNEQHRSGLLDGGEQAGAEARLVDQRTECC